MPPRPTRCPNSCDRRAGQLRGSGASTPNGAFGLDDGVPHTGSGRHHELPAGPFAVHEGPHDLGITSPAFWRRRGARSAGPCGVISSRLWSVAGLRSTRDLGRRQVRERREGPGPADVRDDVLDVVSTCSVGTCTRSPSAVPTDHAEAILLVEPVHHDDAVGLVREGVPGLAPGSVTAMTPSYRGPAVIRIAGKPERAHAIEPPTASSGVGRLLEELIRPERTEPGRGHGRVLRRNESAPDPRVRIQREPASSRSALIRTNSALGMKTSPRTSGVAAPSGDGITASSAGWPSRPRGRTVTRARLHEPGRRRTVA